MNLSNLILTYTVNGIVEICISNYIEKRFLKTSLKVQKIHVSWLSNRERSIFQSNYINNVNT